MMNGSTVPSGGYRIETHPVALVVLLLGRDLHVDEEDVAGQVLPLEARVPLVEILGTHGDVGVGVDVAPETVAGRIGHEAVAAVGEVQLEQARALSRDRLRPRAITVPAELARRLLEPLVRQQPGVVDGRDAAQDADDREREQDLDEAEAAAVTRRRPADGCSWEASIGDYLGRPPPPLPSFFLDVMSASSFSPPSIAVRAVAT